ncbi:MAG: thermonuclease family protein, partial [Bacteroidota bacterium]
MTDPITAVFAIVVLVALVLLIRPAQSEVRSIVRHVHDGDTIYLKGVREPIRIWGINAPEIEDPGGWEAKDAMKALVLRRSLRCVKMDRDHYNRIVAKCFLPDGRDVAAEMIKQGHAFDMPRYSRGYYKRIKKGANGDGKRP